jgi:hypothetical protein
MDENVFKRINVFKGFVRTAKDYTDAVEFHVKKQHLHNHGFHGVGVVPGVGGELQVRARRTPSLAVEMRPGYAIDPSGRDIVAPEVEVKEVPLHDFSLPRTVYLRLRYAEDESDFRRIRIPGFPEREGYARLKEGYRLEWTVAEPDPAQDLEVCRLFLTYELDAIRNAADPNDPKPGEIDLRWVRRANVCGGSVPGVSLLEQRAALRLAVRTYTHIQRSRNIPSAGAAATASVVMGVLNEAQILDPLSYLQVLGVQRRMFRDVVLEAEQFEPKLTRRPMFGRYKGKLDTVGEVLGATRELEGQERREAVQLTAGMQREGIEALHDLIRPPQVGALGAFKQEMKPGTGIRVLDGTEWERLKIDSRMPYPTLVVEGREWKLIDEIDLLDGESERVHRFAIREAQRFFRSQITNSYPDGSRIFDSGIGHEGGFAEWEIQNVTPGLPLVILRRMDYGRGDYWCRVWVNEVEAGEVPCMGEDQRYRWRNWPFGISEHFVRQQVVRVRQAIDASNRDVNYFRLWFYQPI